MIKRLVATTTAAGMLAVAALPAYAAPDANAVINMTGSSPDTCTLAFDSQSGATNASFADGTPSTLTITNLADATTALGQEFSINIVYDAMCNYAHNVSLQSTSSGMIAGTPPTVLSGTFDLRVNYDAALSHSGNAACAGNDLNLTTSGDIATVTPAVQTQTAVVAGACDGQLTLNVSEAAGGGVNPLVAATYTDTLTLQIGAAL